MQTARVTGSGRNLSSEDASNGLALLNELLAEYDGDDYTHTDLTLDIDVPLDSSLHLALRYSLACLIGDLYGKQFTGLTVEEMARARARLDEGLRPIKAATMPTGFSNISTKYHGTTTPLI